MLISNILIFIVIICVIVVAHELGHFLLAKANGITVKEFFVGMGPTLCSFTKNGTKYSLKLFPIGGACMFEGEDGRQEEGEEGEEIPLSEGAFPNASVWARIGVVAAGPVFNFLLAFLFAVVIVGNTYSDKPVVQNVKAGYSAEEAGIRPGDLLTRMAGERIYLGREVMLLTMLHQGETIEVSYKRDGETHTVMLEPKLDEESGRYLYGFEGYSEYFKCSLTEIPKYSYYEVRFGLKSTVKSLKMIATGKVGRKDVSGPIGIAQMVGDVTEQARPYGIWMTVLSLMNLAMLLSVNLGVLNLLPIPALDGGRLVFLAFEVIRGKPVPAEKEGMIHLAGFALLIVFMVLVMFNDISRLIG